MSANGIDESQAREAVWMVFGEGCLSPRCQGSCNKAIKEDVLKLNEKIMDRSINDDLNINHLASSFIEGGVNVDKISQMHIRDLNSGIDSPEELANLAWETMKLSGRKIVKDSKTLATEEENIDYLVDHAKAFLLKSVPILRALEII